MERRTYVELSTIKILKIISKKLKRIIIELIDQCE